MNNSQIHQDVTNKIVAAMEGTPANGLNHGQLMDGLRTPPRGEGTQGSTYYC